MRYQALIALGALLVFGTGKSCEPQPPPPAQILSFSVTPRVVCAGESVTVTWATSGGVPLLYDSSEHTLASLEADDLLGEFKLPTPTGTKTVVITGPTQFKLASWLNVDNKAVSEDIHVSLTPPPPVTAVFKPCVGGKTWGSWTPPQWSPGAKVIAVNNTSPRPLTLEHDGSSLSLLAKQPLEIPDSLKGKWAVTGSWSVVAELGSNEGCSQNQLEGPNLLKPPPLSVQLDFVCE